MKNLFIWIIIVTTILFCVAIGFDASPYLRGPSYYPPEWRWEYLFENTLSRIYLPLILIGLTVFLYRWVEKKKKLSNKTLVIFFLAALLLFVCFQFSMLYFSRSGVGVLIHRIINPEINGYFTAALTIQSVPEFLRNYNTLMLDFVYHAKAHPPGAILLFYYIDQFMQFFPAIGEWAAQQLPNRMDVRLTWETLKASEKATVFASAFIIPLLSALSIIPLYFTAKILYGVKAAMRSIFLFLFIPSLILFIPINDAFLHLFSITAFCFFVYELKNNNHWSLSLSGSVLFLGIFFNLSLLPVLVLFFVYFLLRLLECHSRAGHSTLRPEPQSSDSKSGNPVDKRNALFYWIPFFKGMTTNICIMNFIKKGLFFTLGLFLPFVLLFAFFQFNFVDMTITIMKHVPDVHTRSYTLWIFYNLYDFFVFTGLPVALIYFAAVKESITHLIKRHFKKVDQLLVAFTLMVLIVNFSGSVRGETGRIWIPYIPFIVLIVSNFLTNKLKLSTKMFAIILGLQALQILVMQEFWVMLW